MKSFLAVAIVLLSSAPMVSAQTASSSPGEGRVVRYDLKMNDLKYTYSASYTPVLRLKSGNILETNTVDCFGNPSRREAGLLCEVLARLLRNHSDRPEPRLHQLRPSCYREFRAT